MNARPPRDRGAVVRRVVLIDLDWSEADLLPRLLSDASIRVALVAGNGDDDPGLRAAAIFGLRSTRELADLTREIFDLALIGARSPRRSDVARLLGALATAVASPRDFLLAPEGPRPVPHRTVPAPDEVADLLARAIPDIPTKRAAPEPDPGVSSDPAEPPGSP